MRLVAKSTICERELCREEEALFFSGTDCGGAEAARGGSAWLELAAYGAFVRN